MLDYKKKMVKSRTFDKLMRMYYDHIEPQLRNEELFNINVEKLQIVLNMIKHKEPRKKVKYLLNQFLNYCVVMRYVEYNPILSININEYENENVLEKEEKYKAIKPEYRQKFFDTIKKHDFLNSICLTAYFSGLRIGELLGLRWKDIDFTNKILNVEHAITTHFEYDNEGNFIKKKTILSNPKTKSSRAKLPMTNALVETLKNWKDIQKEKSANTGIELTNDDSFVFCNDNGELRTYYNTQRTLKEFLKRNNLDKCGIHFHAIRHTFGDVLRENNWSIYDIQKMLRHSKASTTEIYLSMENNPALKLRNEIDKAFDDKHFDDGLNFESENENNKQKKSNKKKDFEM